jgi:hypothetical protein
LKGVIGQRFKEQARARKLEVSRFNNSNSSGLKN